MLRLKKPPSSNRVKRTSLGRHVVCFRKRRAGDTPGFGFLAKTLRPSSPLTQELYGPKYVMSGIKVEKEGNVRIGSAEYTYDCIDRDGRLQESLFETSEGSTECIEPVSKAKQMQYGR